MFKHRGALGDQGFTVPVLLELRKHYGKIYLFCGKQGPMALGNTGLIDDFLIMPEEWKDLEIEEIGMEEYGYWLVSEMERIGIRVDDDIQMDSVDMMGALADKYSFFPEDKLKSELPLEERIEYVKGVSYFDSYATLAADQLNLPDVLEAARGKRPTTRHTKKEAIWLKTFRRRHNIPKDAFILGWQFTGSADHKRYPFLGNAIYPIMARHEDLWLVTMGPDWCKDLGGHDPDTRWVNLAGDITFRQAYMLTSQYDCLVSPETGVMVFAQGYPDTPKILLASHSYGYHITFGDDTKILHSGAECSPCYNLVVGTEEEGCPQYVDKGESYPVCMATIPPEVITKEIETVYERWSTNGRKNDNGRLDNAGQGANRRHKLNVLHGSAGTGRVGQERRASIH